MSEYEFRCESCNAEIPDRTKADESGMGMLCNECFYMPNKKFLSLLADITEKEKAWKQLRDEQPELPNISLRRDSSYMFFTMSVTREGQLRLYMGLTSKEYSFSPSEARAIARFIQEWFGNEDVKPMQKKESSYRAEDRGM